MFNRNKYWSVKSQAVYFVGYFYFYLGWNAWLVYVKYVMHGMYVPPWLSRSKSFPSWLICAQLRLYLALSGRGVSIDLYARDLQSGDSFAYTRREGEGDPVFHWTRLSNSVSHQSPFYVSEDITSPPCWDIMSNLYSWRVLKRAGYTWPGKVMSTGKFSSLDLIAHTLIFLHLFKRPHIFLL